MHLKIDSWKTTPSFWGVNFYLFSGAMNQQRSFLSSFGFSTSSCSSCSLLSGRKTAETAPKLRTCAKKTHLRHGVWSKGLWLEMNNICIYINIFGTYIYIYIYHGPPKPTCLEVLMVNNLVFRWPKPLLFMVLWAQGIYIYIHIYLLLQLVRVVLMTGVIIPRLPVIPKPRAY